MIKTTFYKPLKHQPQEILQL